MPMGWINASVSAVVSSTGTGEPPPARRYGLMRFPNPTATGCRLSARKYSNTWPERLTLFFPNRRATAAVSERARAPWSRNSAPADAGVPPAGFYANAARGTTPQQGEARAMRHWGFLQCRLSRLRGGATWRTMDWRRERAAGTENPAAARWRCTKSSTRKKPPPVIFF